ncbi:hypothetical protein GCM10007320_02470 [Pseudorhodoferax aquiterrae]|uniref:Uncharacterized protein n=1 Tax=Pseudorhodoferax aquiterrae TaxID=747304 RepID=A0ABQ3FW30_9BURK|nr:hypothetical protein [Pseudorhodoferax aquiterrae]GHC69247.1 hypothetical protein GCM10007320_02470 [Pseudorhodoferax aquiterrae]
MSLTVLARRLALWRHRGAAALYALLLVLLAGPGLAQANSRDSLTLLVPDDADIASWQVKVWTDTAVEEGLQMKVMKASAFLALGSSANASISGLVLPDSAHIRASDRLVEGVKQYVSRGGRLLLVYDAASLNDGGFYDVSGRSRFSDMVGVDYVLYEALRDRVVGFGPVVGTRGRLDNLSLPPGKYMPYPAATSPTVSLAAATQVPYVPTSRFDPGGSEFMRAWYRAGSATGAQPRVASLLTGLRYDAAVAEATPALRWLQTTGHTSLRRPDDVSAVVAPGGAGWTETAPWRTAGDLAAGDAELQVVSGYAFGPLSYYSFVTTGAFPGNVFLSSPEFGLVAGERSYGYGKLLFVNLPLGFFKAIGTDGVLLHGVLAHFARDQVGMPRLAVQPRGIGGLVYNWHVDDGDDIVPDFRDIMASSFMAGAGPFSVHFTAGPDVDVVGDRLGMNLLGNPAAQDVVRRTARTGPYTSAYGLVKHEVGSHGGWIHNIYGINANETNAATYLPWLQWNMMAVDEVSGERSRSYSAPQGNNPSWAVAWNEFWGIVGMYTVSNTGSPATREWRDGARLATKLWSMPVTPFGISATFEDFEANGVSDTASAQWLLDLQSFVANRRSNRMFYNHPPGAAAHLDVVKTFVQRGKALRDSGRFKWYTMAELADFSQRRVQTGWASSSTWLGKEVFVLNNGQSLTDITMLLPRSRYGMPFVFWGAGSVSSDATDWIVTARSGTELKFYTVPR